MPEEDQKIIVDADLHPMVKKTLLELYLAVDEKLPDNFWDTFAVKFQEVLRETMPLVMREHECLSALRELSALNEHVISREKVDAIVTFESFSFMLNQGFISDKSEGIFITEDGFAFLLKGEQSA
tara:strand:+ start:311 stop:685 length:375 start_codon:yes stop_codon:yes gene_type:complete